MSCASWLHRNIFVGRTRVPRRPASWRPAVEALEDRVVPASLSYSSYLPGPAWAIAVDSSGDTYLTGIGWGSGVYVAKLNATGTALDWVTNLGSSGSGSSIAVDAAGNVYVAGWSSDSSFPTTANALAPTKPSSALCDFLTILKPSGSSLLYSTWLPGTFNASAVMMRAGGPALAIDHAGDGSGSLDNVYLTGEATVGLLTTSGAYQPAFAGGTASAASNAFFAKIDPNLAGSASLLYGSYLGGSLNDAGYNSGNAGADAGTGIAVDASGNAYLVGRTSSTNFPTTAGAFQAGYHGSMDVFVAKFNPSLSGSASLVYSTYLGGSRRDGYWTDYGVYLNVIEPGPGIAVDSAGDAYVAGTTVSADFPTTPGAFQTTLHTAGNGYQPDAFVTKLNPTGTGLIYSTYLGGSDNDGAAAIALDASGNAYVTGWTRSSNFPTLNPIQAQKAGGLDSAGFANSDVFVTTLNSAGTGLLFSTYFGGRGGTISKKGGFTGSNGDEYGYALALDAAGDAYVAGATSVENLEAISTSFPTTAGAYDTTPGGGLTFMIDPPAGGAPGGRKHHERPPTSPSAPRLLTTRTDAADETRLLLETAAQGVLVQPGLSLGPGSGPVRSLDSWIGSVAGRDLVPVSFGGRADEGLALHRSSAESDLGSAVLGEVFSDLAVWPPRV